ncbi:uracil-DNA glycosylase family protein [Sphingomonas sp. PR090111-T3T-6A]|uniref:uracil-DNA glycosylase family protein n=1 Tax=Sphingomonas sp. PR090111-T3T-6A TaxID=685778 RepID=UPI000363DF6C|nr:uracil-DNA glycosylase family protein [Sphingomonas sp. PR090111-T3T-6A]
MMLDGGDHRFRDVIASALGWWADAGVDNLADDATRDWLAPPPPRLEMAATAPIAPASAPAAAPEPAGLPDTIEALQTLLATGSYMPNAAPPGRRVGPSGAAGAELMIVADMPDPGDGEAGHLFGAETGRLFDAMLAAMGRDRARIYTAPLSPARIAGRIDEKQGEALARLMRRHIALAKPKALILFGDEAARWLIGPDALSSRGGLRMVQHDEGSVPAIATFHPRHLRRMPALKGAAWADMRLLLGVLAQ